jgi:hypothetical protein
MMTNELLTREDLQQLMRLSCFTLVVARWLARLNVLLVAKRYMWLVSNATVQRTERNSTAIKTINKAIVIHGD